jgi:tetratricopeptide (TPR) repeat protein
MNDMTQRERLREKQVQSADANRLKGNTYFKAKKYDVALTHYLDALKSQPFDVKVLMNIAQCYLKLEGGQEDAWEFISRVLRIQPNHAKVVIFVWSSQHLHTQCA